MTSMLLRLSMAMCHRRGREAPSGAYPPFRGELRRALEAGRLRRLGGRLLDVLRHHVRVRRVPVGHLDELATLHLPDLDEPAALVVGRGDLERRHQPAEGEVRDLL